MYDKTLVLEISIQIYEASQKILSRFSSVKTVEDFTHSEYGMQKFDSICMLLIAIGEALKNIDKVTKKSLLPLYPQVDWEKAKGLRDIISHHYFHADADIIYRVCEKRIPVLAETIKKMIDDLSDLP